MHIKASITDNLSNLGLKSIEIKIYITLIKNGALTAREIANELYFTYNNVYRTINKLVDEKLAIKLNTYPTKYQATSPTSAINRLGNEQISNVKSATIQTISDLSRLKSDSQQTMHILTGQKDLLSKYAEYANKSCDEVLVISIGEPVPDVIWSSTELAISKGIKPKFIFHKNDKENYFLIKKWQNIGVQVRYQPLPGYHLYIFDTKTAVLSASNSEQTQERTGVLIQNKPIVESLRTYFFQQWDSSTPIS